MIRTLRRTILAALAGLLALTSGARAGCEGENILPALTPTPAELGALRAAAAAHPNAEGRFWRVERAGTPPSHLFGTYHASAPEVATPPAAVAEAVRAARLLFVEVTPEEMGRMQAALNADPRRIVDATGAVLDDFLSPSQRAKAEKVMADYGVPWATARRLKPWFLQMQLAQPPCEAAAAAAGGVVLDMRLVELARAAGVETRGLETWDVAIGLFEDQPIADQRRGLMLALDMAGQAENLRRTALELYLAGEVMMIWEMGRVATRRVVGAADPHLDRMEREFWEYGVDRRNRSFVATIGPELARGGVVVAVGALHLPGEAGLVELLRAEGYRVTREPAP